MKYLNLGCGSRFHPSWTNVDVNISSPYVQVHDLCQGLSFPNDSFDVVYHSHLLEHLPKDIAPTFIQECHRVLKPGGIIRVVVPDLERIVRLYLLALERALLAEKDWADHYSWLMLELYDQAVRESSGGQMLEYLKQRPIPNEAFVYERLGGEARRLVQSIRSARSSEKNERRSSPGNWIAAIQSIPQRARAALIRWLLGKHDYKALQIGRFRSGGEVHQWMYDRYSLALLLEHAGFQNSIQRTAFESEIDNWAQFNLDTEPDGTIYKPDSLYLEGIKPDA